MPNDMTALPALLPSDFQSLQSDGRPDGEDAASIRSGKGVGVLDDKSSFVTGIVGTNTHGRARASRAGRLREWICQRFPRFAAFVGIKRAGKGFDIEAALVKAEESLKSSRTEFVQLLSQYKTALAKIESDRILIEQLGKDLATQALDRENPFDSLFATLWDAKMQARADEAMALADNLQHQANALVAARNLVQDPALEFKPTGKHYSFQIPADSDASSDEADLSSDEADFSSDEAYPSIGHADQATFASHTDGALKMDESWRSKDSGYTRSTNSPVESDVEDIQAEASVPKPRATVAPLGVGDGAAFTQAGAY